MVWRLRFYKGVICRIFGWRGFKHTDFETRRMQAIETPSPRQQQHDNQTMDERVGAQVGGLYVRPFGPPLFTMVKILVVWGGFEPSVQLRGLTLIHLRGNIGTVTWVYTNKLTWELNRYRRPDQTRPDDQTRQTHTLNLQN